MVKFHMKDQLFIDLRKSLFSFVPRIFSSKNSMASTGVNSLKNFRKIQTRFNSSSPMRISSLRVPDRFTSTAGKIRLSLNLRSSTISILPVPLNSSKMTSSILLPVSTRAVAMIVRLPPSSIFRAAPKNLFGRCKAFASTPPERIFPECGTTVLWARANRVILSSRITTSCFASTSRFAF